LASRRACAFATLVTAGIATSPPSSARVVGEPLKQLGARCRVAERRARDNRRASRWERGACGTSPHGLSARSARRQRHDGKGRSRLSRLRLRSDAVVSRRRL
jgi:hypothetical protein